MTNISRKATYRAFAKINLSLDVLGRLENGYHSVKMVMQTVSLYDVVSVETTPEGITLSSNLSFLPTGSDNLAYKAAEKFFAAAGVKGGADIRLRKHIPVGAGLAGGSSDCAAVLRILNRLYGARLSVRKLCEIGATLGADVPYCLLGGTRLAQGIGEKLSPLPPMPDCHILLVKPAFSISTKTVYERIDSVGGFRRPDTEGIIAALKERSLDAIVRSMGNVLEEVCVNDYPVLKELKARLIDLGAIAAQMSGSGPTVFGIFTDEAKARNAKDELLGKYKTVYLCKPV